jgi:hypothetical protein
VRAESRPKVISTIAPKDITKYYVDPGKNLTGIWEYFRVIELEQNIAYKRKYQIYITVINILLHRKVKNGELI